MSHIVGAAGLATLFLGRGGLNISKPSFGVLTGGSFSFLRLLKRSVWRATK